MTLRRPRRTFGAVVAVALGTCLAAPATAGVSGWPSEVKAVYDVKFGGFNVGDFTFKSKAGPQGYTLDGSSKLSVLLGAFKWRGAFKASGRVEDSGPKPVDYKFAYRSNSKRGSVKMSFNESGVLNVALDPPKKPSGSAVPLKEQHLRNVLDPLSAIMALSRAEGGAPCDRKIAVFDGKQRFDIALEPVDGKSAKADAASRKEFVCRVLYRPIAGHKPNKANKALTEGRIEAAFRPTNDGKLVLPWRITIPTAWGSAELVSKRIDIVADNTRAFAAAYEPRNFSLKPAP